MIPSAYDWASYWALRLIVEKISFSLAVVHLYRTWYIESLVNLKNKDNEVNGRMKKS